MSRRWIRSIPFAILLVLFGARGAPAAQWNPDQLEVPAGASNAALGVSGRAGAVDEEGNIHLVFQVANGSVQNIVYTMRSPGGAWSTPIPVSAPQRNGRNASTLVDEGGRLHVFWEDWADANHSDIMHRVRQPDGSWGDEEALFANPGFSLRPVAASDPFSRVHLVWADSRFSPPENPQTQIVYSVYTDGVWSPVEILSPGSQASTDASVDVDGLGRVHIVWSSLGPGDGETPAPEILYLRLDPDVPHDLQPTHLVRTASSANSPYLEVLEDGTIHLVWLDSRNSVQGLFSEIYYKRFLPDIGWGKDKRFTYDLTTHLRPLITVGAEGSLNVVWEDYRSGNPEIYYRQITWETGWDRSPTRLTVDNSTSRSPSLVALNDGGLVLFWTDTQTSGNSRIFTKTGSVN
jgi:hypothetical protein